MKRNLPPAWKTAALCAVCCLIAPAHHASADDLARWNTTGGTDGFKTHPAWKAASLGKGVDGEKTRVQLDPKKLKDGSVAAGELFFYRTMDDADLNPDRYLQVVLTPLFGFAMDLELFSCNLWSTATGPSHAAVRSSLDNFQANLATLDLNHSSHNTIAINLSKLRFKNLRDPVEFRIYLWGATGMQPGYLADSISEPAVLITGKAR